MDRMEQRANNAVANWLFIGVAMTVIQIALGGITRLTGSGLSITEWDVVTGALPPLNEAQWQVLFQKYQATPQYHILNFDFTLENFKFIFFWEWFHRLWARTIGLVFAVGFLYFLFKQYFKSKMIRPLVILFLLGALQGAIGWIMVASGLVGDAVYVKPTKLALHFIFAIGLLAYTFWFALVLKLKSLDQYASFLPLDKAKHNRILKIKWFGWIIIILLTKQLIYGALMAGHKAANMASTWPTINGAWWPVGLTSKESFLINAVDNPIWIHFIHRSLAYLLILLIIWWSMQLKQLPIKGFWNQAKWYPLILVCLQVVLGIATVLTSKWIVPGRWAAFEWLAQLHQLVGILLVLSVVMILYMTTIKRSVSETD